MNYNGNIHSTTNQRILGKLVDREVLMCGTDIVEYILKSCWEVDDAPFTHDDIENNYRKVCPKCSSELEEIEEEDIELIHKWQCKCCGRNFDDKEEALECCYSDEEDREDLEENDMIEEIWLCPFCEDEFDNEDDARDCSCHFRETLYKCTDCDKYVLESEVNEEENEAYEWWFVTGWFADKLKAHGEMVIDAGWHYVWGRCCTGQSILLDYVIGQIGAEMGILEGQEYDWSKYE